MGRKEYLNQIRRTPLFHIDREKDRDTFYIESAKLCNALCGYLLATPESRARYEEHLPALYETALDCIKYYDPSKGEFLAYFMVAVENQLKREYSRIRAQSSSGVSGVPKEVRRHIAEIRRWMERRGKLELSNFDLELYADEAGIALEVAKEAWSAATMSGEVVALEVENEEGDEFCLADLQQIAIDKQEENEREHVTDILLRAREVYYGGIQERQRALFSAWITALLSPKIAAYEICVADYAFLDKDVLLAYIKSGKPVSQRALCERFGLSESDLSNRTKRFAEKMRPL